MRGVVSEKATIFRDVELYISNLLAQEDDVLKQVLKNNTAAGLEPIHISPIQGKLLQILAKSCRAKTILEIGTHGGYSTIWLARALPESGKVMTIEIDSDNAALAKKNFKLSGVDEMIEVRIGKALDVLQELQNDDLPPFDMIFIDADKPPYAEYFDIAIRLSRPGGIIVADNVIREGKVLDENSSDEKVQGVQRLNKMLSKSTAVAATILSTFGLKEYDGMVVAVVN